ncbi:MAG TPA: phosphatase PAP2 family protein [Acetobacteraceae bacterium]|nr:phosphatase PAP2 family protein [Acetobacteraceae bacterium]
MTFLTDFADEAVILPVVLAVGMALFAQGWRRGAAAWVLVMVATFAAVLALKLLFLACSTSLGAGDIRTPSGHVAAATVVAGGLAALLLRRRSVALPLAGLVAIVIGVSRLALGLHSLAEVVIGAGVGLAGAWALLVLAGRPPEGLGVRRILVIVAVVAVLFHGLHLPAEAHIRSTAWRFAHLLAVCQSDEVRL